MIDNEIPNVSINEADRQNIIKWCRENIADLPYAIMSNGTLLMLDENVDEVEFDVTYFNHPSFSGVKTRTKNKIMTYNIAYFAEMGQKWSKEEIGVVGRAIALMKRIGIPIPGAPESDREIVHQDGQTEMFTVLWPNLDNIMSVIPVGVAVEDYLAVVLAREFVIQDFVAPRFIYLNKGRSLTQ